VLQRLRIAFLGTADFAVPTLHVLATGPDDIVAVFTRRDRPAGRGRRLRPSPVKLAARDLGLALLQPERVSEAEGLAQLKELTPDVLFVAAFGELLKPEALSAPRLGAVNLHASLLPRYRGAAPIQRALLAGETETGVTVQWMAAELDAGDIILQRAVSIGSDENFGSLHDRLAGVGAELAAESMALLREGDAPRVPQQHEDASHAPPVRREELVIDWRRPAAELARVVRAFSPSPGARTTRGGRLLKVLSAREGRREAPGEGIPGRVMEVTNEGFSVRAGEGRLEVLRVQPEGRTKMSAADYAKGHRLVRGEELGGG
jgi:methionyl-tRNA formyltransferase